MIAPLQVHAVRAVEIQQFVTLRLNGQLIGFPIGQVRDVFQIHELSPVPRAHAAISGLVNLRGRIVLVLSLAGLLGLPASPPTKMRMAIGVDWRGETIGVQVDQIGDVISVSSANSEPFPGHISGLWTRHARCIHKLDNELMIELDLHSLIDTPMTQAA